MSEQSVHPASAIPASPMGQRRDRPEYRGRLLPLFQILLVNFLLNVVTFGFYRFWGKTRIRNYIWSHLRFRDEDFEYNGTGMELFVGFLVALAVLIPLGIAFQFISLWTLQAGAAFQGIFGAAQGFLFLFLIHFAIFRARRYRLSRTNWHGIRAGQDGSGVKYAGIVVGHTLLNGLTAGLSYPWMQTAMTRHLMDNTHFGHHSFTFASTAKASDLFGAWFVVWSLIGLTALFQLLVPAISLILFIPAVLFAYARFRVHSFNYYAANTFFGGLNFKSRLTTVSVLKLYAKYVGCLVLLTIVGGIFVSLFFSFNLPQIQELMQGQLDDEATWDAWVWFLLQNSASLIVIALIFVFASFLSMLILTQGFLRMVCENLDVVGELDLNAIRQSNLEAPSRGEGFADALDVGGL